MRKLFFVIPLLLLVSIAFADIPRYISIQGRLSDSSDIPLSGSYNLRFGFYDSYTGGNLLDTVIVNNIDVNNGLFNVEISPNLDFDQAYYIEVSVWNSSSSQWVVLSPLINLTSVAYSYSASRLLPSSYDVSAPRFVDFNDNNYYCDPSGVSKLSDVNVTGNAYVGNDLYMSGSYGTGKGEIHNVFRVLGSSDEDLWIGLTGATKTIGFYDYAHGSNVLYYNGSDQKLHVFKSMKMSENLGTHGYDPDSGYPSGWSGGVHTLDMAAEGSVAARQICLDTTGSGDGWSGLDCRTTWPSGGGVTDVWVNETGDTMTGDLSISKSAAQIALGEGYGGPHGIRFGDTAAGEGMNLYYRTAPNQLIVEDTSGNDIFYLDNDDDSAYFAGDISITTSGKDLSLAPAGGEGNIRNVDIIDGLNDIRFTVGGVEQMRIDNGFWPIFDNSLYLGLAGNRWKEIYGGSVVASNDVNGSRFCLNGDCRVTWPSGGGVTDVWVNETGDTMTGSLYMSDNAVYLRGTGDNNHGIRWSSSVDGPRIFGYQGVEIYRTQNSKSLANFTDIGLTVGGNLKVNSDLESQFVTGDSYIFLQPVANDRGRIGFYDTSSGWLDLTLQEGGGNVGIGDATPDYKLDVNGNTRIIGALRKEGGGDLIIKDQNGVSEREAQFYNIDGTLFIRSDLDTDLDYNGDINIQNGLLFLDGSANRVGIGTTSPQARIHATGGAYGVRGEGSTTGGYFRDTDGTSNAYIAFGDYSLYSTAGRIYQIGNITATDYVIGNAGLCIGSDCRNAWPGSKLGYYVNESNTPMSIGGAIIGNITITTGDGPVIIDFNYRATSPDTSMATVGRVWRDKGKPTQKIVCEVAYSIANIAPNNIMTIPGHCLDDPGPGTHEYLLTAVGSSTYNASYVYFTVIDYTTVITTWSGSGGGCLEEGSLILTPDGFKRIEELKVGDYVIGYKDGKRVKSKILKTFPHYGKWKLYYYKGYWFTGDHEIYTPYGLEEVSKLSNITKDYEGWVLDLRTETGNYFGKNDLLIHNLFTKG